LLLLVLTTQRSLFPWVAAVPFASIGGLNFSVRINNGMITYAVYDSVNIYPYFSLR